jgi:hypothetical protein
MHTIKLTTAEVRHLLSLLHSAAQSGEYYGNRRDYWQRAWDLESSLNELTKKGEGDGDGK